MRTVTTEDNPYKVAGDILFASSEVESDFRSVDLYGSSVRRKKEDAICSRFHLENESGTGDIAVYQTFPGMELVYNDMHMEYCNKMQSPRPGFIEINYCREGRCECAFGERSYCYMAAGNLSICTLHKKSHTSTFPTSHYHGITITIELEEITDEMRRILKLLSINLTRISEFAGKQDFYMVRANETVQHIFSELYTVQEHIKPSYIRIKLLELLLILTEMDFDRIKNDYVYFSKSQRNCTRQIHDFIVGHIKEHYTIEELAERFEISPTAMKRCFKGMYGTFILLIPTALMLFSAASGQADRQKLFLDFLFYSLFTPVCTTMMNRIMFASEQLMAAKSAVSRIEAILQEKPLKESNTQKQPKDASVVFEDVSFTYPGAKKKALYHVSFEVPDGKKIALVGASGSGKSTAASLIPRFYDVQEGDVLVGGVDVREIAKNDLMDQIAFVFQNTRLFNDTLLENIRASRPDATREEVMRAAEAAQCQDIIERLPNGLDTIVGSGGTYLSGGENQRIALARAILKDAPIIILDEATAFADAENEHQIQLAFEGLTSGKTVLMIAHRLSTIQDADMILVFGDGKIIERGNHDELLKQNGVYASMWKEYQTQIIWKVGTTVRKEENHD